MHLNGELVPLDLVELFSILSCAGTVAVVLDKFVCISQIIASRVLYCSNNAQVKFYDE